MATKQQFNFSGGMNTQVSNLLLKENETELIINHTLDKVGALTRRKGVLSYGSQLAENVNGAGTIFDFVCSTSANSTQLITDYLSNGASSVLYVYEQETTTLNGAITTATTTVTLTDATNFASSGYIEIDGDIIQYTGKSSNDLTGCTRIDESHSSGATVRQWRLSDSSTGSYTDTKTRFVTFLDYVFRLNDQLVVSSATNPAPTAGWSTTNCPGTITPSIGIVYKDKMYLTGDSTKPNYLYFSSKIEPTDTTITWDVTNNYIPVDPENGDVITGLAINNNVMLVFKKDATYRWDGNAIDTEPVIDVGTTCHDSIQTVHGITFFANKDGVYAYTKGQPKLISRKIQRWWDAIAESQLTDLPAGVDKDHYYISIGSVTIDGITHSNVELVYNIPLNAWTVNKTYSKIRHYAYVNDADGSKYFINAVKANETTVIRDTGTSDIIDLTNGSKTAHPINSLIRTREYLTNFPAKAQIEDVYVSMQQAVGTKLNHRIERSGDFKPTGQMTERVTRTFPKEKCSSIQFEITDNSINQPIFEGLVVNYTPLNQ